MKLIVGLGNPGNIYRDSRHNIGFAVVKALAKFYKISLKKDKGVICLSGKGKIGNQNTILAMPLTFMNLSGKALEALIEKYKIDLHSLLVVCDDLDLEFARLKIRPSGSSGGHHGLESIIKSLGSQDFARLRIGIGRPSFQEIDAAEYVLSAFTRKEKGQVKKIIKRAVECCKIWATEGISKSMNVFNRLSCSKMRS